MNLNLSASLNIFKLLTKPSLCLPHATVNTFDDLPVPLDKAFARKDRRVDIRAVVLDKDDCFAYPQENEIYEPYKVIKFLYLLRFASVVYLPVLLAASYHECTSAIAKLRSVGLKLCEQPTQDAVC